MAAATVPTGTINPRTGNTATNLSSLLDLVGTDAPTNAIPKSTQALIDAGYLTGYQTGGEGDPSQSSTVFQLGPNAPKTQYGDATMARASDGAFTLINPKNQYADPNYGNITSTANTIDPSKQRNIYDLIGPLAMSAVLGGAGAGLFGAAGLGAGGVASTAAGAAEGLSGIDALLGGQALTGGSLAQGSAYGLASGVQNLLKSGGSGAGGFLGSLLGGYTGVPGGSAIGGLLGGIGQGLLSGGQSSGQSQTGQTQTTYQAPTTQQVAQAIQSGGSALSTGTQQTTNQAQQNQGNPMLSDLLNPWKQAQNSDDQNRQWMYMLLNQNG